MIDMNDITSVRLDCTVSASHQLSQLLSLVPSSPLFGQKLSLRLLIKDYFKIATSILILIIFNKIYF